jgi:alpha-beta hydrolase superfamily lysophospholipase
LRGVIILAHGLGEHGDRYGHLYDRLLPEGYGFYALDHRGFGRSGGKRGYVDRFRDYVKDLDRLVQRAGNEHPDHPLILYGHSMGGLMSLAYAMAGSTPVKCLVIASPPIRVRKPPGGKVTLSIISLLSALFPGLTVDSRGNPRNVTRDPVEVERKKKDSLCHTRISLRWIDEFFKTRKQVAGAPHRLDVPSLLMIQGTGDKIVSTEAVQRFFDSIRIEDKTLLLYPDYYHELHNDSGRERPLGDVAEWLNLRVPSAGGG